MECNKDEATRAKTIAEKKLADKDFTGAKKFTLKAQTLYPELDGISQMLTILDVYISAENKVGGELDWYGILGVNPSDDDETIRKQYRKLALMLHPDKSKSVGADGAFKLLSEAWSLLSDKAKRLIYNQRRSLKCFQQKVPSQSWGPPTAPGVNSYPNLSNHATSNPKSHRTTTTTKTGHASVFPPVPPPDPPPKFSRGNTFWTICHQCRMRYEYLKVYLNRTLLCPNCQKPFLAKATAAPTSFSKAAQVLVHQQHKDSSKPTLYSNPVSNRYNLGRTDHNSGGAPFGPHWSNNTNSFCGAFSETDTCKTDPSIASKAADVVQRVNERVKREREQLNSGFPSKNRKVDGSEQISLRTTCQTSMRNDCGNTGNIYGAYGFFSMNSKLNSTRELTLVETRHMLIQKAQKEICRKVNEWLSEELEEKKADDKKFSTSPPYSSTSNYTSSENKGFCQTMNMQDAMNVPDPDFHDFDLDRTENSFLDNQVWAAYDDDDGMPRFYALIHKVLSRNPLKLKISWLNSKTTAEFGQINWIGSGFRKTCGEFRVGKFELNTSLNSFSQKVEWMKTPRGSVIIYPRKGEVWALYRHWSRDWNEHIPDHVIHQYDMVTILDDYNQEQGVLVSPLVKFTGFRTVFYPVTDQSEVKKIPKEEMYRFSHQVPKYLLTGEEAHNSPKGFLELDPAATPFELIHTTN